MSHLIPHWFDHKLKSLPRLCNESSLLHCTSIKDKQTIISHLEKGEKGTNLALKFKISKQQISDICENKEILKFIDSVQTSVGSKIQVLKASAAHLYHCKKISLPKG